MEFKFNNYIWIIYIITGFIVYCCYADISYEDGRSEDLPFDPRIEDPRREDPRREDPRREDPRREDPRREDPRREDPRREDPRREDPRREDPRREDPRREDPRREDPRRNPPPRGYVPTRPHPCDQRSCYPQTGNLLIGREANLTATSTCGLQRQERYCVISHLEDKKKCFRCDSREQFKNDPGLSHRIENILHRFHPGSTSERRSWWQSENGVENVSIQLDLEAEFHFTHMIITFKTFRPAAMLIEKSTDFGKTWKATRYFAYNCKESFPEISEGQYTLISDVICESRYSTVAPSSEGEVIFRVLPKNVNIPDPYAQDVQDVLRMTNLRINFTKLHTLGDDLLDRRQEIQEKYYYSIYEMVVRGSCSCYGHASRCLPGSYSPSAPPDPSMIHGQCECTHNTKGLNCELCMDFHYDVPWKPAFGKQSNACKRCNCHNHATTCFFDENLYAISGNVSGGHCMDCLHNTMGPKCSMCKPFFYLRHDRDIAHEDACARCECDPRGSVDDGLCEPSTDLEKVPPTNAGKCHCKLHAAGQRCDSCEIGYWDLREDNPEGCRLCTCNTTGTEGNQGCDMLTGECRCKTYVTGRDCNQCLPGYWGLSKDPGGCKPCNCDIGGAKDNNCDVFDGKCKCRPNVGGRDCSVPEQGFFAPNLDYYTYEAELARLSPNCQVVVREPPSDGRPPTWTGTGFARAFDDSDLEFLIDNIITPMEYDLVVRYEPQQIGWHKVNVVVTPEALPNPDGPCANNIPTDAPTTLMLRSESREEIMYPSLCLENGRTYRIRLDLTSSEKGPNSPILIDSIALIPRTNRLDFLPPDRVPENLRELYERYRCGSSAPSALKRKEYDECLKLLESVGYYIYNGAFECGCNLQGSISGICDTLGGQCQCNPNVVGRDCSRCAPGTAGFGPEGCKPCECNPVGSLDTFCDVKTGQCRCRSNTFGLHCDQCQHGYWGFPNCKQCQCNGHADKCEALTGKCIDCNNNSTGNYCDTCVDGFYGDPRLGVDIPCRQCPCPSTSDTVPLHYFATTCHLDRLTNDVRCECNEGYSGAKCDVCAENYFGNPEEPGGSCRPCECNSNIELSRGGNCDRKTGQCLQCQYNTDGWTCENCRAGYFGDALMKSCRRCECNMLGTDPNITHCHAVSGQCPCLPNVVGSMCDACEEDHWKIASGKGCEPCACDLNGSERTQCNLYDGQCECKPNFGGRNCSQCQTNFWGDPTLECYPCECDRRGSSTLQCDRNNGSCVCIPGIGGHRCSECARGYMGLNVGSNSLSCSTCGECFGNWDRIIQELKRETVETVAAASEIKQQGTTGAYSREFDVMQTRIDEVKNLLKSSSVSTLDLDQLQEMIDRKKELFGNSSLDLDEISNILATVSQKVLLTNVSLAELERKAEALQNASDSLKDKAINLQEANVEGALLLTKEARRRSDEAVRLYEGVSRLIRLSETQRQRVDSLLASIGSKRGKTQEELKMSIGKLELSLGEIRRVFPELNTLICDKAGDPCDSYCGGAGCGKCGGISCEGAVTNSEQALKFAQDAQTELKSKDSKAEEVLRGVMQTKKEVDEAKELASRVYEKTAKGINTTEESKKTLEGLEKEIQEFLNQTIATPVDIRTLAEEVLKQNITLRPAQIDQLAVDIRESIQKLSNIDQINRDAEKDLQMAESLKRRANSSATEAAKVLEDAVEIRNELEKAEEAQKNAEEAIETAREDITQADIYLKQIGNETASAERRGIEGLKGVTLLKDKLTELQKKNLQNERKRAQAKSESDSAFKNATALQENASKLNVEYGQVYSALEAKLRNSEGAKGKDEIQNRANRLANNVKQKLIELQEMESEYLDHERRAKELTENIEKLNLEMEEHLGAIRIIEEYHGTCNS